MTRLIFTCLLLLISLMVIQYTIWTNSSQALSNEEIDVPLPLHKANDRIIRQDYMMQMDTEGRIIVVKKQVILEI